MDVTFSASGNNPDGNATTVTLPTGSVQLAYDAWGRVVHATGSSKFGGTTTTVVHTYSYDALGRQIVDNIQTTNKPDAGPGSNGTPTTTVGTTRLFYDGQNVIEERNVNGVVTTQYVWSAAGPNSLVLRDSQNTPGGSGTSSFIPQLPNAPLNQRLYAQDNGQGSITSITGVDGTVIERYLYDQEGQPVALQPNWTAWSDGPTNNDSRYNWQYLWHGQRYTKFSGNGSQNPDIVQDGGLYTDSAGQGWYDPFHGVSLQPDFSGYAPVPKPSDPTAGQSWLERHWVQVTAATIGIGVGILTGGLGLVVAGALGGAAGGFVGGSLDGYAQTGNYGTALGAGLQGAAIGGIAGAAGGFVGGYAGSLARGLAQEAGIGCGTTFARVGGFISGAAEGAALGGTDGFIQGGFAKGWNGALDGGLTGLLTGGILGGTLGALLGKACFSAGTEMMVPIDERGGEAWCRVECLRERMLIWMRDENKPEAPPEIGVVEEVFSGKAMTMVVVVAGRVIRTTAAHRFHVQGKGWTLTSDLKPGDRFIGKDGRWVAVMEIPETGELEDVYNVRVSRHHTYFVGGADWGFSVWAHNTVCGETDAGELPRDVAAETVAQKVEAYEFGEQQGRGFANSMGLRDAGWANLPEKEPWSPLHDEFGSGFDDVMRDADGNLMIVEYKGGTGELSPEQFTEAWVRRNIAELRAAGHPLGQELQAAFTNQTLGGIAIKTPWAPSMTGAKTGPGETFILGQWTGGQWR